MLNGPFALSRSGFTQVAQIRDDRFGEDEGLGQADAGGGAADDLQSSNDDAPLEQSNGTESPRSGADEDDEDDDTELFEADADPNERIKKLTNALKRKNKKLAKARPTLQRMKELGDRGETLDELLYRARQHREMEAAMERNPALRRVLNGGADDDQPARPAQQQPAALDDGFTFEMTEDALGFDPNASPANRAIATGLQRGARAEFMLQKLLQTANPVELARRVSGMEQTTRAGSEQQIDREWSAAIAAAVGEIEDEGVAQLLKDSLVNARRQYGGRVTPQKAVDHYLSKLKVGRKQMAAASAAAAAARPGQQRAGQAQRAAERVSTLPRTVGNGAVSAPARQPRETLADVRRRITGARR